MTDPTKGNPKDHQRKQVKDLKLNTDTVQELTRSEGEEAKGGLRRRGDTDSGCTTSGSSCCSEISTDCC
jgi:hypothetical protein